MTRWLAAGLLILALALSGPAGAQSPAPAEKGVLHGRISDTLGAAISRAFVLVHRSGAAKESQQLAVSENGEFQVQLAPGLYDLFIGSPGFIPYAKAIMIPPDKPVELKIKLRVDMEHLED